MQAGLLDEVLAGHRADGHHAADVFDGRCQCHRQHVEDGPPVEFRRDEVRQGQPGRGGNAGGVDDAEGGGQGAADHDAGQNRHQAEQPASQRGDQQRGNQRAHRDDDGGGVGNGIVAAAAHGHAHCDRRQRQADGDDHRGDDHRRQQAVDEAGAAQFHRQAHQDVDDAGGDDAAQHRRQADFALDGHDRRDEGEARCQEHRHFTAGHQLEQQGADAGGKQRHVGVHAGQQRHQYQGAEGHEQHLRAGDSLAQDRVLVGVAHAQLSFCLVPKILSPASPRPGMM